ncbi:MAG TPA: hypothetical protein VFZ65_12720 [Planctomycetota bacterium]|nr:hypothetical protein [Planctomycetota bacterium]
MATLPDLDPRLFRASALVPASRSEFATGDARAGEAWPPPGRIVELTGGLDGALTSMAVAAVARVQQAGGITAWLQPEHGLLFPPDLASNGVDLDALVVVHVPVPARTALAQRGRPRTAPHDLPKAAELLLRSGAFDLLVLDLRPSAPRHGAWLVRLQALARTHRSRVLLLSDARAPVELGSTSTLRLFPQRKRSQGAFVVEPHIVKDKLHDVATPPVLPRRGPMGLS